MSFIKTLPKNITLDILSESICKLLNQVYSLPVNKSFIKEIIDKHFSLDSLNNIIIKKEVVEIYAVNSIFLKELLGISFETLVEMALNHSNTNIENKYTLTRQIKQLETEISNLKEVIEELRESYIRVKRNSVGIQK